MSHPLVIIELIYQRSSTSTPWLYLIYGLHCPVLPQEAALTAFRKTYDKTVALGHRLDIVFYLLRIGLFYMDSDLITRNSEKAKR